MTRQIWKIYSSAVGDFVKASRIDVDEPVVHTQRYPTGTILAPTIAFARGAVDAWLEEHDLIEDGELGVVKRPLGYDFIITVVEKADLTGPEYLEKASEIADHVLSGYRAGRLTTQHSREILVREAALDAAKIALLQSTKGA